MAAVQPLHWKYKHNNMSKGIHLLLAEDDENLGTLLSTFLRSKGYTVDLAEDGKEALDKSRNKSYQ